MLHRWKFILTNWINCYSNEGIKKEQCVNLESLLTIISHLHENLNFDESKSSKLEAHTVEEFVREKYPQFKFENGTVEASNEEELYIVASLLLFFVCVNSKDVDIKNAMCSKLSSEDQETIMKFSKSLMECSPITFSDVQAAITEACGQDVAAVEAVSGLKMVAETPPALRSLHGEVRRLQAALDAERFDKNFLQEELARTNLKLEKLLKDKEQCKLDIVNLKSKISLCWGQETEVQGGDATSESTARLTRQLEDLEERLVLTQEQLDDAMSERDTYKAKVEQLKQERDKWLSVSQSEASRAAQLSEELETERHHVQSLQDLVSELRQHNLKNCLDASQLECDDPDASIHSLHNASVCSEACANVIEVQLSEERAKIVFLKQQVQGLQDQLTDLNQRAENETQSLRSIISDKDNDIFNLRHRINEEIEEKNNLNAHFSEEICRLNNEITKLTQKLQHNSDSFRQVIEQKMQEIQTLQEEKLSLLQSLSDETTKLESIIIDLRTDIVTEKNIKQKMKEDYENHMMKLNEKVLNRNNELVELQNNVFEKSELIEQLYQDLRKEKEAKEELSNKCNDNIIQLNERNNAVERNLQQKCEEAKELQKRLQQNGVVFSELNKEIDDLKDINSELTMKCRILEDTKVSLLNDLQHHAYKIEDVQKEMKNIHQLFSEEKEELEQKFNERNATIDSLKVQLHDEIQYKTGLQNELATLQHAQVNLNEEVNKLNKEITTLKSDVQDKDRLIYALDLYLKEEKHLNKNLKQDYDTMSEEFKQELENKCTLLKEYQTQAEKDIEEYKTEISSLKITIDCVKSQLTEQIDTLKRTITSYESDLKEKDVVIFEITKEKDKLNDILVEQKHNADLCQTSLESNLASLNKELDKLKQENNELLNTIAENETVRLNQELSTAAEKLNLANKCALLEEYQAKAENQLEEYKTEILTLKTNIDFTKSQSTAKIDALNTEIANYDRELKEKDVIMSNIMEEREMLSKALIEFKKVDDSNQKELESKSATVNELRQKLEECKKEISSLMITTDCVKSQFTEQIDTLKTKLSSYESDLKEKDDIITQIIEEKDKLNEILVEEKDNAELHQKDLESNVAYLNKELDKIKQENNELLNKMSENESVRVNQEQSTAAEKLELANKCSLLEEYQSKAEKQLEEYKTEISSLETNIDFIKSQFTTDIDALKKQIANYDCELKNKLVVVTNITEEKEMLSKALIEVKEEGDKYKTELVSKTAVIEELRQKLEEYKTEISSLKNTTDYVELQLTERIDTLKTTLTSYESDLKEKDVIISEITEEKNKLNEILVEQSNSAEIRQKDLESNVASLKEELGKLNQENNELLIKMAENETVRVNQELSTVAEKMNLTNKCSLLEEYQAKAEKQLEEYKTEISSLKTNIDFIKLQSTADIDALRTEIANNDRELKEKDVIMSNITEEKEMLSKALIEVKEVGDKYQKELESNAAIIRELRRKLEEYQREISSLKNTTDCLESQLTEQINTLKTTLTSYESDLKEKDVIISQITEEKDKLNKILVEQTDSAELRQEDLESNFASLSEEFDKMKQENNELQNKMAENETLRVNQELSAVAEKMNLASKCSLLEEYQAKAEKQLEEYKTEISSLKTNIDFIKSQSTADIDALRTEFDGGLKEKDVILSNITEEKEMLSKALVEVKEVGDKYQNELESKAAIIHELRQKLEDYNTEISSFKITADCVKSQLTEQVDTLKTTLTSYESDLKEKDVIITEIIEGKDKLNEILVDQKDSAELRQRELESNIENLNEELDKLKQENNELRNKMADNKTVRVNKDLRTAAEKLNLANKCSVLEEYQAKAEKQLEEYKTEISSLKSNIDFIKSQFTAEIDALKTEIANYDQELKKKDIIVSNITEEKEMLSKALVEVKEVGAKYRKELESKAATVYELRQKLEEVKKEALVLEVMQKENDHMITTVGQLETFALGNQEKSSSYKYFGLSERQHRDRHQVSTPTSDLTHSSMDSLKTISDLEKIINDKNRTITTLQSDITYLKSLMADSENKLLDVNKELEGSQETCQLLSSQLKKIVQQKNEEIADLKKQITKMSVTENRASQIIKVSAKYQAIILKRIAEIKSNTILKELTNFGNTENNENEFKRSLNSAITMEDLENFLETTDRHLKRCTEKQLALQKDRDRLTEVNRINESEIINMKKFLTELSISFKTFSSIKDLYAQKLSRVVSVQRTVRRDILNLDGRITDTMMCKLERGYAAIMQDLSECAMNLERWVERCIGRSISAEKIKQAFSSESDRTSLASTTFQNTSIEVQLEELENSFQKLLEEVLRAQKGEGAKDAQAVTVMEVRAEYEDKLNRMKAKMKQLYQEQIAIFKDKQKDEVAALERELVQAREKLAESSKAYEEHIRSLTTELWSVGEKFLMKKEEAEWLRRKQHSGSLMSLQHVHSSGLVPPPEEPSRPSDTYSLRSLPVNTNKEKRAEGREGRGMHMSDEEGEVFDNRWLKELSTPRRESVPPGQRLSELRWRNSLCPPHLKSSYPAETQFTAAVDEEDIKCIATANGGKQQRKEVGITAYKKPGPPTPSKQAGRLSATGSDLRESLRVEAEPQASRKTSTPSRLRSLFRSTRNDTTEGTPRSRRLSNIFRKK